MKGALAGAFTAAAFYGVGEYFQGVQHQNGLSAANEAAVGRFSGLRQASAYLENAPLTSAQRLGKVIAHGIVGGSGQEIQGGQFGHGFISAGTTQAFSGFIEQIQGLGAFWIPQPRFSPQH